MKQAVSWLGAPPERELPLCRCQCDRIPFQVYVVCGEAAHVCDKPYANFVVLSAQPVRTPGPNIFEKLPFETALPNPLAPCLSVPPSR